MEPIKFVGMNATYVAEGCGDLPAAVEKNDSGVTEITSVWKPCPEELQLLNEGGCVRLTVVGCQPPVALWVSKAVEIT